MAFLYYQVPITHTLLGALRPVLCFHKYDGILWDNFSLACMSLSMTAFSEMIFGLLVWAWAWRHSLRWLSACLYELQYDGFLWDDFQLACLRLSMTAFSEMTSACLSELEYDDILWDDFHLPVWAWVWRHSLRWLSACQYQLEYDGILWDGFSLPVWASVWRHSLRWLSACLFELEYDGILWDYFQLACISICLTTLFSEITFSLPVWAWVWRHSLRWLSTCLY